ncbi:MAG: flagellar biosynthesis protein FlhB [Phycisphaerales bacterium]
MAEELGERTEQPTARRLTEARNRGQIPKSTDLSSAVVLFAAVVLVAMGVGWIGERFVIVLRTLLDFERDSNALNPAGITPAAKLAAWQLAVIMIPVLALAFVVAYLSHFIQVGWLITFKPIEPKIENLSPLKGIKRIFGLRGQVKTVTNTLKLVVMVVVAVLAIAARLPAIAAMPRMAPDQAMRLIGKMGIELALILVVLLLLIALIDFLYQRWQHTRDLRMTKQEVKDERRSMEGDPQLKGRRFRMYQQIVMQQIAAAVPQADVVITNPTHFAVAVRYDPESMAAPKVVAKGADELAARIRNLATLNEVPMVSRPPLARALYWGVEVGQAISPEHYEAVAEILAYVYRIDQRPGHADNPPAPKRREPETVGA